MEIIVNTLSKEELLNSTVEIIKSGVDKLRDDWANHVNNVRRINLSLDLTKPEYVFAGICREKGAEDDLLSLRYCVGEGTPSEASICYTSDIPISSDEAILNAIRSLLEKADMALRARKNIDLGTFTVDVQLQPDGKFDVYIAHEGSSGEHYIDVTADKIGELVAGDVECIAEGYQNEFGGTAV